MNATLPIDTEAQAIREAEDHPLAAAVKVGNLNTARLNRSVEVEIEGYIYLQVGEAFFAGCSRCGGTGHYSFNGEHSRCYQCDNNASAKLGSYIGDRTMVEKHARARRLAKERRDAKREAKAAAARAKRDARVEALKASDPEVFALLQKTYDDENEAYQTGDYSKVSKSGFLRDMAGKVFNASEDKDLTENMLAALRKIVEADKQRAADRAAAIAGGAVVPVVEGRVEITGTVVSTKTVESDFGTGYKMLVQDSRGFRVYGSIPSNLWSEVEFLGAYRKSAWNETDGVMTKLVGMEIKFTATVEKSSKDEYFGFFKRPAKAEIVA